MRKHLGSFLSAIVLAGILMNAVIPIPASAATSLATAADGGSSSAPADTATPTPGASDTPLAVTAGTTQTPTDAATSGPTEDATSGIPASASPTETMPATATATATATPAPSTPTTTATATSAPSTPTTTPTATSAPSTPTTTPTATPTPSTPTTTPTQAVPSGYSLSLQSTPAFLPRGGSLILNWTITVPAGGNTGLVLQISLPSGVIPAQPSGATFDAASGLLSIPNPNLADNLKLSSSSASFSLSLSANLLQGATKLATASLLVPTREQFQLDKHGGNLSAMNGRVKLSIPAGLFANQTVIQAGDPSAAQMPAHSLSGHPFELDAQDNVSKKDLHQFSNYIRLDVSYADLNVDPAQVANLHVYWYNPATKDWAALGGNVNPATQTIHTFTNHFTVFDIGIGNFQISHLPTVNDFQVSGSTGAATYSMPIEVPQGPGGLQPNLTLDYNSQVIDQSTTVTQASWVGMGWSLDVGMIERNMNGNPGYGDADWGADDTFSLNLAGLSSTIYADPNGVYHSANENFLKYTYDSDPQSPTYDTWTVQDKVGNVYTFAHTVQTVFPTGNGETSCGYQALTYQWWLTSVKNIYGKQLTYTYTDQTASLAFLHKVGSTCSWDANAPAVPIITATYPNTIVYPNNRYRVRFVRQGRSDYTSAWTTDDVYHNFELSRLRQIYVEQDAAGDGSFSSVNVIRRYRLDYADNAPDNNNNVWPGITWSAGGKTSTLADVYQFGSNNASNLPGLFFTYGDGMHLTHVQNNYGGGNVTFAYNLWAYTANGRQSNTIVDGGCHGGGFSPYVSADTIDCPSDAMYVHGNVVNSYLLNNNLHPSMALIRPGGTYSFSGLSSKSANITVNYGIQTGSIAGGNYTDLHMSTLAADGTPIITVPATDDQSVPWTVWISAQPNPGTSGGSAGFKNFTVRLLSAYYQVSRKTVNDGRGHSYVHTYTYSGQAVNDSTTSASACSDGGLKAQTCFQYNEKYSEFRGSAQVIENDYAPNGVTLVRRVVTRYNQDDAYKGLTAWSKVMDGSSKLLTYQKFTYPAPAVTLPVFAYSPDPKTCNGCRLTYTDITRYWITVTSEEDRTYNNDGTYTATQKAYTYDSNYGNQLTEADSFWNNGAWELYRTTQSYYDPNASAYLVGLVGAQNFFDANNKVIAKKLYLYDGNTAAWNAAPPTVGKLTAVRTWHGSAGFNQESYTYDGWGNRNTVTTYSGHGSSSTAPTGGARTTIINYDTTYHTYARAQTDALGRITYWTYDYTLGVPLSETDPNGNVTSASYDVFGRLTQLVKPGDTAANPTLSATYVSNIPFEVDLSQNIDGTNHYSVHRFYDGLGRLYQTQTGSTVSGTFTLYNTTTSAFDADGNVTSQSAPYGPGETPAYTNTTYDTRNRPLAVTAPDGTSTNYSYNGLSTTLQDPKQNRTTTTIDVWGRTVSITPPTGPGITYGYDELGNLTDAWRGGLNTHITYDAGGRKTAMTDPDMGSWTYQHDALGNLTSQTDANGCTLSMTYDSLSRLTAKSSAGNCGTQEAIAYTYDQGANGLSQRTGMTDASGGSTSWAYNQRGKVINEIKTIGSQSFSTDFTYNSADLPVTMKYPGASDTDRETVTNTYTSQMMLDTVIGTDNGASTYIGGTQYDAAGRMTSRVLGNGLTQTWNYYSWAGKDPSIPGDTSHAGSGGKLQSLLTGSLQNLAYSYDSVGNIAQITNSVASETQGYSYDALDRLTSWTLNGTQQEGYGYDGTSGNLNCKAGACPQGTVTYTYDPNHPHAVSSVPDPNHPSTNNTYSYDADGNQVTRTVGGVTYTLGYDAEGRLVTVTGGSTSAQFTYDGDGSMVQAALTDTNGTHTTTYANASYQVTDAGVVTKYYPGGAYRVGGTLYFSLTDQLGSTGITTDASGAKIAELRYTAWGEVRYASGSTPTDRTYTGQRSYMGNASSGAAQGFGLMYYNARWYDPYLNHFTQPDTIIPGGVQGYDRYAYAKNNPVRFKDPSGHASCVGSNSDDGPQCRSQHSAEWEQEAWQYRCSHGGGTDCPDPAALTGFFVLGVANPVGMLINTVTSLVTSAVASLFHTDSPNPAKADSSAPPSTTSTTSFGPSLSPRPNHIADSSTASLGMILNRYVSSAELTAIRGTNLLRGGNPGPTYMTTDYYDNVGDATSKLSLPNLPDYGVQFKVTNTPDIAGPDPVAPDYGQAGGGIQYMTEDAVEVDILDIWELLP